MLPINNFYTGEGSGVYIPELGKTEAAVTRAQEGARRLQETKFADALRKREEMIKVGAVTPVDVVHEKIQTEQALKIDGFQKEIQDTYAKYHGDIPTDVMLGIISKRNALEGWQKQVMATEKVFMQDHLEFSKNEYDYRPDVFAKAMADYYDTGKYMQGSGLKAAPINTSRFAIKNMTLPKGAVGVTRIVDGEQRTYYVDEYMAEKYDDPDVLSGTKNLLYSSKQYADNIKEQFMSLPEEKRQQWIDKAEMSEEKYRNPLIHYAANDVFEKEIAPSTKSKSTSSPDKSGSWIFNNGVWMSGGKQMATTGPINEAFTIPQGETGITLKGGLSSINNVTVTAQYIDQIANNVKPKGGILPSTMTAKPVHITNDYVEWIVDNKKDRSFRWYDPNDPVGEDGLPVPKSMTGSMITKAKASGWTVEEIGSGSRLFIKYKHPDVVVVRTPRLPYKTSLKNFMGNDYEDKMGWKTNEATPIAQPPKVKVTW